MVCIINILLPKATKIIGFLTLNPLGLWMLIISCMRFDVRGIENKPLSHEIQNHLFVEKLKQIESIIVLWAQCPIIFNMPHT
jgi:hypothetical protein